MQRCATMSYKRCVMDKTITIRISDEIKSDLNDISKSEDKSVSDLVRESLKNYIAVRKFRKLREKVLPFAEAQGMLTDEEIFKNIS